MKSFLAKILRTLLGQKSYAMLVQFLWQDARNELAMDSDAAAVRSMVQVVLSRASGGIAAVEVGLETGDFAADWLRLLPREAGEHRFFCFHPDAVVGESVKSQMAPYASLAKVEYFAGEPNIDAWWPDQGVGRLTLLKIGCRADVMGILKNARNRLDRKEIDWVLVDYGPEWINRRQFLKDLFACAEDHNYTVAQLTRDGVLPVKAWYADLECFQPSKYLLARRV